MSSQLENVPQEKMPRSTVRLREHIATSSSKKLYYYAHLRIQTQLIIQAEEDTKLSKVRSIKKKPQSLLQTCAAAVIPPRTNKNFITLAVVLSTVMYLLRVYNNCCIALLFVCSCLDRRSNSAIKPAG